MRSTASTSRRVILSTSIAALLGLAAQTGRAADLNWEPDGLFGAPTGGSGNWDTTSLFWNNGVGLQAWNNANNDTAVFGLAGVTALPPFTVTLIAPITAGGLRFNASNYTITGDTLTLGGATPTITVTNAGDVARVNSIIAGTAFSAAGPGTLVLGGANTFTGLMTIGSGSYVGLTSAGALGTTAGATSVLAGGTLNIGGQAISNNVAPGAVLEDIRIAGTGVGGIGALINTTGTGTNTLARVTLTADATISAGGSNSTSYGSAGNILTGAGGRIDVRLNAAPTADQKHLDLGGFTLTKTGGHLLAIVNADVSNGNIVINEGQMNFEGATLLNGTGTVTVNQNGKLGFWSVGTTGTNITRPITLNGGTIGDPTSTGASQVVGSPITITGSVNPNFVATANTTTLAGKISEDVGSTITEFAKRGGATLALSNQTNDFDAQIKIYAGSLQANYTTAFAGGVAPAEGPVALTGSPLGTSSSITIAGGSLNIRVDGANNNSNQVFTIDKTITVDVAPGTINLDRLVTTAGSDKNFATAITFAAASAANGYSIGQNQLTGVQTNGYRTQFTGMTMASDTVLTAGDFTFNGNVTSPNRNSLIHTAGNSWGFIGGETQEFNAVFNLGNAQMRVGAMYGTGVTSTTVKAGTGTIYSGPNNGLSFRAVDNIAPDQAIEIVSQLQTQSAVNFEQFTSVPANLRATGTGVLGVGSATAFGPIDLGNIGDGTFRIGSGIAGSGAGTITGVITPGAGNLVRVGAQNTTTISGTNLVTGSATLDVGSDLINGGFRTFQNGANQNGTVVLTGANDYSGGTNVNRGSTSIVRAAGALGTGAVNVFGTLTADQAGGTLTASGTANINTINFFGGSTLFLDNSAVAAATDVNRYGDASALGLVNTTLTLSSRNLDASETVEAVGAVTYAGGNVINLNRTRAVAGHNVQLTAESLTRTGQGTIELVRTTGTGAGYGGGQKLVVTNGAPIPVNGMVSPSIVAQNSTQTDFLTYGANGFAPVTYDQTVTSGTYTAGALNFDSAAGTGGKVAVTTAALTLQDNPNVYALRTNQSININGTNNKIEIRSGGLISDATTGTATIAPAVVFSNGTANIEGIINSRSGGTLALTGAVTANGLTKFGAGTLNLTANNATTLAGTVAVNQGTLQLFGTATANANYSPAGTGQILLQGGQLNLRGNATTGVSYVLQNAGVAIAKDIPIATINVDRAETASTNQTITINPAAAGTGLVLNGSAGTQGQTLNVTGANGYALAFGANAQNTLTGNVTIHTGSANLSLGNNPTIVGTAPVITKSGGNSWIIGTNLAAPGAPVSPVGTTVVLNDGTVELRSINALGSTGANTSLVLNRGTLNLRRDSNGIFGNSAGYPVTVNGNSAISADRLGGTVTNFELQLGRVSLNDDATLTLNSGNGYSVEFTGANLNGWGFVNSNIGAGDQDSATRFVSSDISGGALVKGGSGHLHILSANNTYSGGTYIQTGIIRARAANAFGTGPVFLNPGAIVDFNNADNLATGQTLTVRSNSAYLPMISVNTNGTPHPTLGVDATAAPFGIVGLSNGTAGSYDNDINLGALYGGRWSLGGVSAGAYDPTYTGALITAGADGLYRLGGGGTSFAMGTDSARVARTNVLTGANDVRLGFDSVNLMPANQTNFQYSIAGVNDFSGGSTVIHRGMVARLFSANDGTRSGLSNSAVDVFGVLSLSGTSSLTTATGNTNAVTLHPGSALFLDNNNGAANSVGAFVASNQLDRLNDAAPIALDGAMLNLIGNNNAVSSETVGAVTYSKGARLRTQLTGTGTSTLTLSSLTPSGPGATLILASGAAGSLGAGDKILVTTGAPSPVNGMVSPSIVNQSDNTFVTYGANGFANVAYDKTVAAPYAAGSLLPTDKVDVGTAALTLADNPTVYALRTNQTINVGGPYNNITIRSGGLIANGGTINPILTFNDGTQNIEARIFTGGAATIANNIIANGVTKFGNNTLTIAVPQTGNTGSWIVNSGNLTINDPQGLGNQPVTLNAALTTGGQAGQNYGQTTLNFSRNMDTPELVTFSGGLITVNNEATIVVGPGADNRNTRVPSITADSSSVESSVGLTLQLPNARTRSTVPTLTLNDDLTLRVWDTGADLGRVSAVAVESLVGVNKDVMKIGNRTLELIGNNTGTFTGGSITVAQGTLRVRNAGALGLGTTTTIERNAALEIAVPNFTGAGSTIVQVPGSVERWNQEDARGATGSTFTVPTGVNLQLNTNLLAARTINMTGGSLEGFLYTDHVAPAVERTVGSAVTINLSSDSLVGQNILQGQGYDTGRAPTIGLPFGTAITGAFLRIDGNITGPGNLTKTGLDTVIIAGAANTYGNTTVEMGTLRIGRANALPTGKALATRLGGTFDLYGNNQTVAGLGVADSGPNPGGVNVGSSGSITNSGVQDNTLTVDNTASFTYNGMIERNVALTKRGVGVLTLGGENTYAGETMVDAGTLSVTGSIAGSPIVRVASAGTLAGTGTLGQTLDLNGVVAPGISGVGNIGDLTTAGLADFKTGSTLSLEIGGASSFDQLTASSFSLTGTVTLNLSLAGGFTPVTNTSFTLLENTGVSPITGFLTAAGSGTSLTEGTVFQAGSQFFQISYQGGVGANDVVVTAVIPEPGVALSLIGGMGVLLGFRRRRSAGIVR